jgi:hypothetical protein
MLASSGPNRYSAEVLKNHLTEVLTSMKTDTELFIKLLCSYPSRITAIIAANGKHTDY